MKNLAILLLSLTFSSLEIIRGVWVLQNNANISTINYVSAIWTSATNALMVGYNSDYGAIIRTTNGGATWQLIHGSSGDAGEFSAVTASTVSSSPSSSFSSCVYAIAVTRAGYVYASSNGGSSFTQIADTVLPATRVLGASMGSNGSVFIVGYQLSSPKIFKSSTLSGFTAWFDKSPTTTVTSSSALLTAVSTIDGANVIAVGYSGVIYVSSNGGDSWGLISSGTTSNLLCVSSGNATVAIAAGDDTTVIKTVNRGQSWISISSGVPSPSASININAVSMVSPRVAYLSASTGVILRTTNGGVSWTVEYSTNLGSASILSLSMWSIAVGVAGLSAGGSVLVRYQGM
jgi:photosystem II stability/assembly factor-like uncharacterized protein